MKLVPETLSNSRKPHFIALFSISVCKTEDGIHSPEDRLCVNDEAQWDACTILQ